MSAHPFVGIDVSKERLDIGVGADGDFWQATNEAAGIQTTLMRLITLRPALVVVESTGGLEWPVVSELAARQIPLALVNPGRVREFAKSLGCWPRPINSTLTCWPASGKLPNSHPPSCRMKPSRSSPHSWLAAGSCWRCW